MPIQENIIQKHLSSLYNQLNIKRNRFYQHYPRFSSSLLVGVILLSLYAIPLTWIQKNYESLPITLPPIQPLSNPDNHAMDLNSNLTLNVEWTDVLIQNGDTLSKIFQQEELPLDDLKLLTANPTLHNALNPLIPGHTLRFGFENTHQTQTLKEIVYIKNALSRISLRKTNHQFTYQLIEEKMDSRLAYSKFKIKTSLFGDAIKNGIPSSLVMQIADIFAWDIDFALDLRPGDSIEMLYEQYFVHGQYFSPGQIKMINFTNQGRTYSAVYYEDKQNKQDKNGASAYYTREGFSLKKAFLRTPVKFTRISSGFTLGRYHPVLHRIRAHRGVDYAAPTGTPVKATSNGTVLFIGRKGGYGNTVILKHGQLYTTLYGHLSRFAHLKAGAPVKQGQIIGYVGQTGLATGPHLHYEFRINGNYQNPLTVKLPKAPGIHPTLMGEFKIFTNRLLTQLDLRKALQTADNAYAVTNTVVD
jgi:murein DD-endopeptidase MepM/ murein hydrolase activator NlpD